MTPLDGHWLSPHSFVQLINGQVTRMWYCSSCYGLLTYHKGTWTHEDRCNTYIKYHSSPHKGCILR